MPLLEGYTKADFRENIRRLRKDGYQAPQAAAIAYRLVRQAAKDAGKRRPRWVRAPPKTKKGRKRPGTMRSAAKASSKKAKRAATKVVTPKITNIRATRAFKAKRKNGRSRGIL